MCIDKPVPHKHADLIKAWADGVNIQVYNTASNLWMDTHSPVWNVDSNYRIKPKPKLKVYKWVCISTSGRYEVTAGSYSTKEDAQKMCTAHEVLEKIEHSMQEFDE